MRRDTVNDVQVLGAFARINAAEPRFLEHLRDLRERYRDEADAAVDDVTLRWLQGYSRLISKLLDQFENASADLRIVGQSASTKKS
jgi:hypothetical protein